MEPSSILQPISSYGYDVVFAVFALSGFVLGWVAQRGNYCFVSSMTSIFTTKSYERFGGLLLLFGLSALLPGALVAVGVVPAVDQYHFNFFAGWYVVLGAYVFGLGAALAGGCNLSMLYRASSGYVQNWLELFGMMVGTYVFAVLIWPPEFYTMEKGILSTTAGGFVEYLPYVLFHSVSAAAIGAAAVLLGVPFVLLGLLLQGMTRRKWAQVAQPVAVQRLALQGPALHVPGPLPSPRFRFSLADARDRILLRKPYGVNLATAILALDMVLVFAVGAGYTFNYLVITSSDGGRFFEYLLFPFGVNLATDTPWYSTQLSIVDTSTLMVVMLCVGAFMASFLSGDFKIRIPKQRRRLAVGFFGGILVGIGVRMALGCNIGLLWTSFAQLGYDGLLFLPAMLAGVYTAVRIQGRWLL